MQKEAVLVLPHQLFENHPFVEGGKAVFLVEHPRFFLDSARGIRFHAQKLLLHRASMRFFHDELRGRGVPVTYVDYPEAKKQGALAGALKKAGIKKVFLADPADPALERDLSLELAGAGMALTVSDTPAFLSSRSWISRHFEGKTHYAMTPFYIEQRKRLGILLEGGKPEGGKWSFDRANRRRLPGGTKVPAPEFPAPNPFVKEAKAYVDGLFPGHPGGTGGFFYPVTRKDALAWLKNFLEARLRYFGDYEDAMSREETFLFHSALTPALNIGLLTPAQVVMETLLFAGERKKEVPLNSLEGFIRQVVGWREFIRAVYVLSGDRERSSNFWGHSKKLPEAFYTGATGIDPVDAVVRRVSEKAYCHHIERLMVLGNFMLLCEIDPGEVFRWFMEMFIDACDWVMVPNVYGMSQYADGGLITTKPYISSSNYILRMSDFPRGPWSDVWDALYWRFVHRHRDFFGRNPRMRVMTFQLDRMGEEKVGRCLKTAGTFLKKLE